MPQWVYVVGNNTGRFTLRSIVDNRAYMAPTLMSWRLYGPRPVQLPGGVLTGDDLRLPNQHLSICDRRLCGKKFF